MTTRRWVLAAVFGGVSVLGLRKLGVWGMVRASLMPRLFPSMARAGAAVCMRSPEGDVVWLIGTRHEDHYGNPRFGVNHLYAALRNTRPDIVALEMLPEKQTKHEYGDAPVEMGALALWAEERGARVVGIDENWDHGGFQRHKMMDAKLRAVLEHSAGKAVTVFSGYGHQLAFVESLDSDGYRVVDAPDPFDGPSPSPTFPIGLESHFEAEIRMRPTTTESDRNFIAARERVLLKIRASRG
jgi:hypothetical protein